VGPRLGGSLLLGGVDGGVAICSDAE
jgi:hypothetical protein